MPCWGKFTEDDDTWSWIEFPISHFVSRLFFRDSCLFCVPVCPKLFTAAVTRCRTYCPCSTFLNSRMSNLMPTLQPHKHSISIMHYVMYIMYFIMIIFLGGWLRTRDAISLMLFVLHVDKVLWVKWRLRLDALSSFEFISFVFKKKKFLYLIVFRCISL